MREITAGDRMTREVFSLPETAMLGAAVDLARAKRIRHIPVVRDGVVVGMLSDRDILRALPSAAIGAGADEYQLALETVPVGRIMTRAPETIAADTPLVEVVERMMQERIGAFPVTEDGILVGIITERDCQSVLIELLAPHRRGGGLVGHTVTVRN